MTNQKIGICRWCIPTKGAKSIEQASLMGYKGVVLDLGNEGNNYQMSIASIQNEYIQASKQYDVQFTTLAANTFCDNTVCKPNKNDIWIDKTDDLLVQTAVDLNIKLLQIPSFVNSFIENEVELNNTVNHLKKLCEKASQVGITVATENALNKVNAVKLVEMVEKDNLKIIFDTANPMWLAGGLNAPEILKETLPYICEVHLKDVAYDQKTKDYQFVPIGTGEVELKKSFDILKQFGFNGWLQNENSYSINNLKADCEIISGLI